MAQAQLVEGLTPHFISWLGLNGYASDDFNRSDMPGGSYGGKASANQQSSGKYPVIFIHGLTDTALGNDTEAKQTGFRSSIQYFLDKGYTKADLYTTTWGSGKSIKYFDYFPSGDDLVFLRRFVNAVLNYTGSSKVDIVCHDFGVVFGRLLTKGLYSAWMLTDQTLTPIGHKVNNFIAIASVSKGIMSCVFLQLKNLCDLDYGLYPGNWKGKR